MRGTAPQPTGTALLPREARLIPGRPRRVHRALSHNLQHEVNHPALVATKRLEARTTTSELLRNIPERSP